LLSVHVFTQPVSHSLQYTHTDVTHRALLPCLYLGRTEQAALSSLVMKAAPASDTGSTPESQLQQIASELSERRPSIPDYGHPFPNPWVPVTPKLAASAGYINC